MLEHTAALFRYGAALRLDAEKKIFSRLDFVLFDVHGHLSRAIELALKSACAIAGTCSKVDGQLTALVTLHQSLIAIFGNIPASRCSRHTLRAITETADRRPKELVGERLLVAPLRCGSMPATNQVTTRSMRHWSVAFQTGYTHLAPQSIGAM
jgi:hypothetical protein